MSKISAKRKTELLDLAADHLNDREWFEYHEWDSLIECEEVLTEEELAWLRANATVSVLVE